MSGHFSARIDIVEILRYQIYVLENETMKVIDFGGLRVTDVEELGAIKLAHRALLDDEYPIVQILRLQKRMYIIHENSKLTLPVAVWQYDGNVEERVTVERLPLATR